MVKFGAVVGKFIARTQTLLAKGQRRRRRLVFLSAFVIVTILTVYALQALFVNEDHTIAVNSKKCSQVVTRSKESLSNAHSVEDLKKNYKMLESQEKSCSDTKKFGILSTNSIEKKLNQIQFYHNKAIIEYQTGHQADAKQNAEKALAISKTLSADEQKKLSNYDWIIKELGWLKEGTF